MKFYEFWNQNLHKKESLGLSTEGHILGAFCVQCSTHPSYEETMVVMTTGDQNFLARRLGHSRAGPCLKTFNTPHMHIRMYICKYIYILVYLFCFSIYLHLSIHVYRCVCVYIYMYMVAPPQDPP